MNRRSLDIDLPTLFIFLGLVFLGWLSIYAVTIDDIASPIMKEEYGRQLVWIGVSFVAGFVILLLDSRFIEAMSYVAYGVAMALLFLVLFFGIEVNGAKSWFSFGFFQIQPSEFAKTATGLALAQYISSVNFSFKNLRDLVIAVGIILLPIFIIILQNDTGSAIVFFSLILVLYREGLNPLFLVIGLLFGTTVIMSLGLENKVVVLGIIAGFSIISFLISSIRRPTFRTILNQLFIGVAVLAAISFLLSLLFQSSSPELRIILLSSLFAAAVLLYFFVSSYSDTVRRLTAHLIIGLFFMVIALGADYAVNKLPQHMQDRIMVLFNPEIDPQGKGYNVIQSKIAIGSGGITGKGFLEGNYTKYKFVPKQETDFIFCTVGEEFGWIGAVFILGLFFVLLVRIRAMAENAKTRFSRVYGYSVLSILFFHLTVNVGMTIGLVPVIGIPLPFFSYGGSSLLGFTIMVAIMMNLFSNRRTVLGSKN